MAHPIKRLASQRSSPPVAVPSASGPSSPRLQSSSLADIAAHRPYHSQPRLASTSGSNTTTTTTPSSKHINIINNNNSNHTNPSNINGYMITSAATSRPTSPTPLSSVKPGNAKHVHTLSANICYPHPSTHPPLRLLTTATCLDTFTSLISAQSPPHSPTFSSFAIPQSTGSRSGSTSSRANSILDGIQNALGAASSPPAAGSIKQSSSFSAAKNSLADFSIAASKRGSNNGSSNTGTNTNRSKYGESGGVIRSNYVSFPNFDDIDFVDVAMVDDDDDEEDQNDWSGPDSPPEGQRSMMDNNGLINNSLDEKRMRSIYQPVGLDLEVRRAMENGISMGMPTTPSDTWLLQLETYHELHVNGTQV